MPRFRLETALHVRERLEKLYQKALAEQVQVEQQYRDRKQLMEETLNHHHKDLDEAKESVPYSFKRNQDFVDKQISPDYGPHQLSQN